MMNETRALASYGWTKSRSVVGYMFATITLGLVLAGICWLLGLPMYFVYGALSVSWFAMLLGAFIPVGIFSFSFNANMLDASTGYDPWLLRLPIRTWKLAIIPAGLATVWISLMWLVIVALIRLFDGPDVPIVSQPLAMSACAIFAYSLVWKPQRAGWQRITLLTVSVPVLYCMMFGCLFVMEEAPRWMPLASVTSVVCYATSIAVAVYSIKLARVSSFQQTKHEPIAISVASPRSERRLVFENRAAALTWHDRMRSGSPRLLMSLVLIPMILFVSMVLPLTAGTAIFGLMFVAAMANVLTCSRIEPTAMSDRSTLPSYLLASPLPSREIALSRLKALVIFYTQIFVVLSLLLLGSLILNKNRVTAGGWWTEASESLSPSAPLRMIVVLYFCTFVASLGVLLRFACVQLFGRQSVVLWLIGGIVLALGVPLGTVLVWFLQQSEWEQVRAVATGWWLWSYSLFYVALAIKIVVDLVVLRTARCCAAARQNTMRFFAAWITLVIAVATASWMLWPGPSPAYITSLMAAVIAIPISPYFLAPLAVSENRHRAI